MRELSGRVAVVTGAASGLGRAMAARFAGEGMKVVIADVDPVSLKQVEADLRTAGATVLAVPTDVSDAAAVEALAGQTLEAFGAVHLLCNNAGVVADRPTWEFTAAEWRWVLGVNLFGAIHGIRAFVPRMLAQGGEGHVVNTASAAAFTPLQGVAPYNVSKAGVVALSETLAMDLAQVGSRLKVSVLCPGFVATNLQATSARNWPASLATAPLPPGGPMAQLMQDTRAAGLQLPATAASIAGLVVAAVRDECFLILPHPSWGAAHIERMQALLAGGYPSPVRPETLVAANG